jgi:hypothetical protein
VLVQAAVVGRWQALAYWLMAAEAAVEEVMLKQRWMLLLYQLQ